MNIPPAESKTVRNKTPKSAQVALSCMFPIEKKMVICVKIVFLEGETLHMYSFLNKESHFLCLYSVGHR